MPFTTKKAKRRFCSLDCVNQWKRFQWEALVPEERARRAERIQARMQQVSGLERALASVLDEWRVPYVPQFRVLHYRNRPESPRFQSGDEWHLNSPGGEAILLSERLLSPWGIMAWGYDP
jgi:hypothetical protein